MGNDIPREILQLRAEVERLRVQIELLNKLIAKPQTSRRREDGARNDTAREYRVRPQNPEVTEVLLGIVRESEARKRLTFKEVVETASKVLPADRATKQQVYSTLYGLVRRGRIVKDERGTLHF